MVTIFDLLTDLRAEQGSDLHLVTGEPPIFRIAGELKRLDMPALDAQEMENLVLPLLGEGERHGLMEGRRDVETTIRHDNQPYRVSIYHERLGLGAAIRVVPNRVPTLEQLGLADTVLVPLTKLKRGLIVVTGPMGSGKSTTVAGMIEEINQTRSERIFTIENPIEYEFTSKKSIITQRTVGQDVPDFPYALRSVMRQDPDVVLIGELRDLESLNLALAVAETGHLVFTIMHMDTASAAINRIIEAFPEHQQGAIRRMVSKNLQAVIAQQLLPRAIGHGRVAVNEILICTPRIRRMIQDAQTDFTVAMEAGRDIGMQTMDDALIKLYEAGTISREMAFSRLEDKKRLLPAEEV